MFENALMLLGILLAVGIFVSLAIGLAMIVGWLITRLQKISQEMTALEPLFQYRCGECGYLATYRYNETRCKKCLAPAELPID